MRNLVRFSFLLLFISCFLQSNSQVKAKTEAGLTVLLYDNGTWRQEDKSNDSSAQVSINGLEIPKLQNKKSEQILEKYAMTISYNKDFKQANWVSYELLSEETIRQFNRTNYFYPDPDIKEGTAVNSDYKGSGFDRGHLAPAGDMGWNETAMRESFEYSNISPQNPSFNRGIWNRLEEFVRRWAVENKSIIIVVGPVLKGELVTLGNGVAIPKYFYKVILDYNYPDIKGIGFIFPNEGSDKPLNSFATTIDSVELYTGIDFYPKLPDEIEEKVESNIDLSKWRWEFKNDQNVSTSSYCNYIDEMGIKCNLIISKSNQRYCDKHLKIEAIKNQNIRLKNPK